MANISSINGNPIMVGTSGIEDGAATLDKLSIGLVNNSGTYNDSLAVELGYYAIVNGIKTSSTEWARTQGFVAKTSVVSVSKDYFLIVVAYEADGTYVGAWNPTSQEFVTQYNQTQMMCNTADLPLVSKAHPEYKFAIDFKLRVGATNIVLSNLQDAITVYDETRRLLTNSTVEKANTALSMASGVPYAITEFVSGTRTLSDSQLVVSYSYFKCTTRELIVFGDNGGTISVTGVASGQRYAIGGRTATDTYNSGWKTDDFSVSLQAGRYYVVVGNINDSVISPTSVSLVVSVLPNSIGKKVAKEYIYSTDIELANGYYAVADGLISSTHFWAMSVGFVPRNLTYSTIGSAYGIVLVAFEKDGTYVGAWTGSGFSTTYNAGTMVRKKINVKEVWNQHPDYLYALDFSFDGSTAIDLSTLKSALSITEPGDASSNDVPSYYVAHMATKVADIRDNINGVGKNGETFVFITDIHWESNHKNSPALVKDIIDKTNVRILLCGGDIINTQTKETAEGLLQDCVKAFDFPTYPMHMAFGNHDANSLNWSTTELQEQNQLSANEAFGLLQKNTSFANTYVSDSSIDFYFDRQDSKTRFIFLDSGTNGAYASGVITDLCGMLTSTPSGYKVVIVQHWYLNGITSDVATLTTSAITLMNVVKQYNDRGSYTYDGTTYSFASAAGEIVLLLGGHTHYDYVIDVDDSRNVAGVPLVCTSDDSYRDRTATGGTIAEQCFDVITLDYTNRTIKCVRIGDGQDRQVSY